MKRVLVTCLAVLALAGCAGPTQEQVTAHLLNEDPLPVPTVLGEGNGRYLLEYPGVQDLPDSWPCGLDGEVATCVWLPKVVDGPQQVDGGAEVIQNEWEDVP